MPNYWGEHTSTIDWCESNYAHTPYIAETINTLTNLPSILLGLYGFWSTLSNGLPTRYSICYLGLSLIGVGSFGFHMSLRWEWQLMDELPMIYVVSYAAFLVLETSPGLDFKYGVLGPLIMIAWDVFVTVSYIYLPNPVYHQIAFAFILLTTTARTVHLTLALPKSHPARSKIGSTMAWGIATFALGFAIWNVDNVFCETLRTIREFLGPLGVFVEGHAYWHLMTGYGAFLIFTASVLLHLAIKVSPDAYDFDEKAWFPVVKPVDPAKRRRVKENGRAR
ncbi:dihydroceramidase [Kwoniella heveanensis CBS 569]|nr:dihydroceramidase [Kwoniella heveanensis CBS 569]